jgi:hypothetical protein
MGVQAKHPAGAEALLVNAILSARLKPCPFKAASFTTNPEAVPFQSSELFREL